jgi:hypothetical protein
MLRVATSEAAAPAAKLAEKVRLFIISVTPSSIATPPKRLPTLPSDDGFALSCVERIMPT